jgi:hypothetical protein
LLLVFPIHILSLYFNYSLKLPLPILVSANSINEFVETTSYIIKRTIILA